MTVQQVEDYVIEHTPFTSSHYNRGALVPMEKAGKIEVVESGRKRKFTFPAGTKIRFL